jgi:predicted ATPase
MGVKESPGRPLGEALAGHLRERRTLLILDNCEHLIADCADFARHMLQASPHLKVLASSREPLRIAGEMAYAVPALPENEAVRLFEDRAGKARPGFRLVNGDAAAATSICRRLDGIPLAIELAASRVRTLSVKAIDTRLDDRFRLLNRGDRSALPRQQTLRALIDWSYELLTEDERAVFRRLAVFAGGWTAEAAEAVTAGGTVDAPSVLEHLTQLVEKSLAVLDASGERYRLLDTVRQYAHERLEETGEAQDVHTRHLRYYFEFAEKARPELSGARQGEWLALLDLERENLLAAHAWCDRAADGAELGLKLVYLLRPFWVNRGLLGLGRRVTEEALARPRAQERDFARCRGLFDAGQIAFFMGNLAEAQRTLEESLAIAREIGDERRIAVVLYPLGMAHLGQGDATTARRYLDEARALAQRRGEPREIAAATTALAQFHRIGGELNQAEPLYEEALRLARSLDDRESIAVGLINLAMVAVGRGAAERAAELIAQALAIVNEIGARRLGQSLLDVCAGLALLKGHSEKTARFFGAAEAQGAQTGLQRDAADAAFLDPLVAKARAALGAAAFSAQENEGRTLAYEGALAEARDWLRTS